MVRTTLLMRRYNEVLRLMSESIIPINDRDPVRFHDWFVRETTTFKDGQLRYTPELAAEMAKLYHTMIRDRAGVSPAYVHEIARVLYACAPDSVVLPLKAGVTTPREIAAGFIAYHEPWTRFRFDPETLHWWTFSDGQLYDTGDRPTQIALVITEMLYELRDWCTAQTATLVGDNVAVEMAHWSKTVKAIEQTASSSSTVFQFVRDLQEHPLVWTSGKLFNRIEFVVPFSNGVLFTDAVYNNDGLQIAEQGEFRPTASADYLVTSGARLAWPVELDHYKVAPAMDQVAPTYDSFLDHAFPDGEEREAILRLLGATVFGRRHKMVVTLIGAPNAGKDTVLGWLDLWLGDQVANLSLSTLTEPTQDLDRGLWPLRNARVAKVPSEVSATGRKLLADRVKSITNGGSQLLTGAGKYERSASFYFDGPLFLHGNDVPRLTDVDQGIRNRLISVPFRYPFPGTGDYRERYYREAPAFLRHLYEAYERWREHGLEIPEAWALFKQNVAEDADEYHSIDAAIVKSSEPMVVSVFYNAVNYLTKQLGLKERSHIHLGRLLTTKGISASTVTQDSRRARYVKLDPSITGLDPMVWASCLAKAEAEDMVRSTIT